MLKYNIYYEGYKVNEHPLNQDELEKILSHKYIGVRTKRNEIKKIPSCKIQKAYCIEI